MRSPIDSTSPAPAAGRVAAGKPAQRTLWFLDFDGVLCDSLPECYAVSRTAYWELHLGLAEPPASASEEKEFALMRPYIRRGADYLLLHLAMREGARIDSQAAFDAIAARESELDARFHELFYRVRGDLLGNDPERWFALNHLYPGVGEALARRASNPDLFILSTKEASFILEILARRGIDWCAERVICSGKESKLGFIDRFMAERGASRAVFVDDQVDHFKGRAERPIRCLLASWGYVRAEWLEGAGYETVSLDSFLAALPS